MESPNSPVAPAVQTQAPLAVPTLAQQQARSGLWGRLPTGLPGAAFWLGAWFCLLFLVRQIPGGFGTFFGFLQFFVGIALVSVALPLLWRLVRKHMLWSLRNKLVLTYLLIGLAPVVLFVTRGGAAAGRIVTAVSGDYCADRTLNRTRNAADEAAPGDPGLSEWNADNSRSWSTRQNSVWPAALGD